MGSQTAGGPRGSRCTVTPRALTGQRQKDDVRLSLQVTVYSLDETGGSVGLCVKGEQSAVVQAAAVISPTGAGHVSWTPECAQWNQMGRLSPPGLGLGGWKQMRGKGSLPSCLKGRLQFSVGTAPTDFLPVGPTRLQPCQAFKGCQGHVQER